jgi:hypothetical protein
LAQKAAVMDKEYMDRVWHHLRCSIEDFKDCVREILRDGPSIPGIIGGQNFQEFSAWNAFHLLREMQDSVLADDFMPPERKVQTQLWALQMEGELRRIFGESFDLWYKQSND